MIPKAICFLSFALGGALLALPMREQPKPITLPAVAETTAPPASMTPASTVAQPQDVAVVAVPSLKPVPVENGKPTPHLSDGYWEYVYPEPSPGEVRYLWTWQGSKNNAARPDKYNGPFQVVESTWMSEGGSLPTEPPPPYLTTDKVFLENREKDRQSQEHLWDGFTNEEKADAVKRNEENLQYWKGSFATQLGPQSKTPPRNAAPVVGRTTFGACGPYGCGPASVPQRYQPVRRAVLPWRRR